MDTVRLMIHRGPGRTALDDARTARLLCADALAEGVPARAAAREVGRAERRSLWPLLGGELAHLALKTGWRGFHPLVVEPTLRVRRQGLGARAPGPPRVLIRVDEFPHARAHDEPRRFSTEAYRQFHDVFASAGVPYLISVLPRIARDYLNAVGDDGGELADDERAMLAELQADGVTFGLHGHTHRTRDARARHRSVVRGMDAAALEHALDDAQARLRECGVETPVFVPPFNHFDADQYAVLARRFAVICGGPESVRTMGLQFSPRWIADAVYLPSYEPLYGRAGPVSQAIEELARRQEAIWAAVTLHFGWELDDDLRDLRSFVWTVAPYTCSWPDFLAAVDASR